MSRPAKVLVVLCALLLAAPAQAADRIERSKDLWATVNVCDTPARPDVVGIRGSMPGTGRREVLQMRFQVQYLDRAEGRWHNFEPAVDSGYVRVGVSRRRTLQSGFSFSLVAPAAGETTILRGAVTFRWRRGGRTTRRIRELTEAGHRSSRDADPADFTAATCELRGG